MRHRYSYSWPLGLLDGDDKITYVTPITNDVIGNLDDAEVEGGFGKISKLEKIN